MSKKFWSVAEIAEIFNVDQDFIENLERENIIRKVRTEETSEKGFSLNDMDNLYILYLSCPPGSASTMVPAPSTMAICICGRVTLLQVTGPCFKPAGI